MYSFRKDKNKNKYKRQLFSWEHRFNQTKLFFDKHSILPTKVIKTNDEEIVILKNWLLKQVERGNKGKLTSEQKSKLKQIGVIFYKTIKEQRWFDRYEELILYKKKYGNTLVPAKYKNNKKLGIWVSSQRVRYKKNKLSKLRIELLEKIDGWIWDIIEAQWYDRYYNLLNFIKEHNRLPYEKDDKKLHTWIENQRAQFRKKTLSKQRILKLEKLEYWKWRVKS